jgi:hypothetical protein
LHQHPRIFANSQTRSYRITIQRALQVQRRGNQQARAAKNFTPLSPSSDELLSHFEDSEVRRLDPKKFLIQPPLRFILTVLSIFSEDTSTLNRPIGWRDALANAVLPANPQVMRSPGLARISIYLTDKSWFWSAIVVWWCWIILVRRRLLSL